MARGSENRLASPVGSFLSERAGGGHEDTETTKAELRREPGSRGACQAAGTGAGRTGGRGRGET